jgi:hypothetical protein
VVDRYSENLFTPDVNAVPIVSLVWSFFLICRRNCLCFDVNDSKYDAEGSPEGVRHSNTSLIFSFGFCTLDFTVIGGNASVIPTGKTLELGQLFSCEFETGLLVSRDGTKAS